MRRSSKPRLRRQGSRRVRTRFTVNWSAVNSLVTVLTALGALLFAGLSLNTTRNQFVATQGQIDIAQESQINDRYSRAVEQLGQQGSDHLYSRVGGIYSLGRLAHDSPRDQPTVLEVLGAFVRTAAPAKIRISSDKEDCPDLSVSPDIQAALTVIGRRNPNHDGIRIDLHGICLRKAQLTGANLSNADLADTVLGSANLEGADLSDANLSHANLSGAILPGANLSKADLEYANLAFAGLDRANLSHATLNGANLDSADLSHANLEGATLHGAQHNDATSVDGVMDNAIQGAWW